ncbi:uncharacterized protein LOC106162369 [Lingula anatina]|uniref:Uncharacterized protein LOC106162369 n=1 Tax=Lingula anatina TaxID=7574 RepID=A0A1S3IA12_LINAN|nr:uncharacterized protein LOC106162369 [Lingula anatina]|eukprot:XP_013395100.1 uncharacterized protein LOC106162369 [Lingula anatina]
MSTLHVYSCTLVLLFSVLARADYPVTASWFAKRNSLSEWNTALDQFKAIGGDTVLQVGASYNNRTKTSISQDEAFANCKVNGVLCTDYTEQELNKKGLKIVSWVTYENNEIYGPKMLACPLDRNIVVKSPGVTYYRIVLHTTAVGDSEACVFEPGTNVSVVFTSSASSDPQNLLLQSASSKAMSVYFGLPRLPPDLKSNPAGYQVVLSYLTWVYRVLADHSDRYGPHYQKTLTGYSGGYINVLTDLTKGLKGSATGQSGLTIDDIAEIYKQVAIMVRNSGKKFLTAPSIDLTKARGDALEDYADGVTGLANVGIDVIALQEGRGLGRSSYHEVNETTVQIKDGDQMLFQILKKHNPLLPDTVTFGDIYTNNTQSLFKFLASARANNQIQTELWLVIQAFDDLGGDCTVDVDFTGSGIPAKVSPVDKSRVDWAIAAGGVSVQKIAAIAWDSLFTCTNQGSSLAQQISDDNERPILSYCNFHSNWNQSVVVIGFNLLAETQGFQLYYLDYNDNPQQSMIHGYYYETDYGVQHHLVPSLQYIMLWDFLPLNQMKRHGFLYVIPLGANHGCVFEYTIYYRRIFKLRGYSRHD